MICCILTEQKNIYLIICLNSKQAWTFSFCLMSWPEYSTVYKSRCFYHCPGESKQVLPLAVLHRLQDYTGLLLSPLSGYWKIWHSYWPWSIKIWLNIFQVFWPTILILQILSCSILKHYFKLCPKDSSVFLWVNYSCIKFVCVYLPAAFHKFHVVFALKVTVQLPFGSINKLTLRTFHTT